MIANYHTHTWRCRHAYGTEREYVEAAIEAGMKILGFADHAPYPYPAGYEATYKMLPSQLEDYVDTILDLRREYKGQIEIRIGLEAEYFPALWEEFLRLIGQYPVEYLLLGQHFLENEYDDPIYSGNRTDSGDRMRRYTAQCMEALRTGRFLYAAHPDLIHFTGDDVLYEEEMTKLCRCCRELDIPVELNLLGLGLERHYPRERFWRIAAREGNHVILGCDAHKPEGVFPAETIRKGYAFLERCGIGRERILELMKF